MELGLARQLFNQKYLRQLDIPFQSFPNKAVWPLLEALVEAKYFSYIDEAISHRFFKEAALLTEDQALLIAYLSLISRRGHLCLSICSEEIKPHPYEVFNPEDVDQAVALESLLNELARRLCQTGLNENLNFNEIKICSYEHSTDYYFQKHWLSETQFIENLSRLVQAPPLLQLDLGLVKKKTHDKVTAGQLLPEQANAINSCCSSVVSVLCGGPGTGKTYTAAALIQVIWNSLTAEEQQKCRIAIAAPTGKAAGNLQKALNQCIQGLTNFKPLVATTIHSLIELKKSRKSLSQLDAHIVIIDESSMIDAYVMSKLLLSVHSGTRLIFIGDPGQLPPVESGALFKELITHKTAFNISVSYLTRCLRAELQEIIDFAAAINSGSWQKAKESLNKGCIKYVHDNMDYDPLKIQQSIVSQVVTTLSNEIDPLAYFDKIQDFCLLSPMRRGRLGVEELNRQIHAARLIKNKEGAPYIAPIMILRNSAHQDLYNGDIGLLVIHLNHKNRKDPSSVNINAGDYALFPNRSGNSSATNYRQLSALLLPAWDYAYAMTVHKSQGSEFQHVLLVMPEGAEHFGREGFYTAITRAKRSLEIWGSDSVLKASIEKCEYRNSGISQRV